MEFYHRFNRVCEFVNRVTCEGNDLHGLWRDDLYHVHVTIRENENGFDFISYFAPAEVRLSFSDCQGSSYQEMDGHELAKKFAKFVAQLNRWR